jgi:hypothetical protein
VDALRHSEVQPEQVCVVFLGQSVGCGDYVQALQVFVAVDREEHCEPEVGGQAGLRGRFLGETVGLQEEFVDQVEQRENACSTAEGEEMPLLEL